MHLASTVAFISALSRFFRVKINRRMLWQLLALALLGALAGFFLSPREAGILTVVDAPGRGDESVDSVRQELRPTEAEEPAESGALSYPEAAISGELVLHFDDEASYVAYLEALRAAGLVPLGQLPPLRVVRVTEDVLRRLPPGSYGARADYAYRVQQPLPPEMVAPRELGKLFAYGVSAAEIAGGTALGRGEGVLVAILDSGIEDHPQFEGVDLLREDLVGGGSAGEGSLHGTSVASIIGGRMGIVPEADLLILRVLDDQGQGNSFQIAEGIVRAVEAGADIINLSLGLYADAPVVREAVRYAQGKGVLLVAAAGNDGYNQLPYPAAYDGVLSVTALDASGRQAGFPNQSVDIDFAAPGVGVETAGGDSGTILFSGTSAAAPFVSGTLAALMSGDQPLEAEAALEVLRRHLNDAGAPGADAEYGGGALDWERLQERGTTDIVDVALAGIYLDTTATPGTTMPVEVTVQNRGTKWLSEAKLEVIIDEEEAVSFVVGALGPGQITSRKVYVQLPSAESDAALNVAARVLPEKLNDDVRLGNNLQATQFRPR